MPRRLNVSPVNNKFIEKIFTIHFPRSFDYVTLFNYAWRWDSSWNFPAMEVEREV